MEKAAGSAAEGIKTTLHYASNLDNPENHKFRIDYKAAFGTDPSVFSVQGYDTGSLLLQASAAVGGDVESVDDVIEAMESSRVPDSPRGPWSMSKAHNPIQNIYLRQVEDGQQKLLGIAAKSLADPAVGCKMG